MKIGVYVCECGTNIAKTVDVPKVTEYSKTLPNVTIARSYKYMCSEPGQALIKKDIKELKLDRVVVASCSPRMHEPTFRNACQEAGLNPYCFEMANIREHCSWIHEAKEEATEKAITLVKGAVARAGMIEPLERKKVNVTPSALVLGGGIAGIQAAIDIADRGFKTYLVEKEPSIGGRMAQLDKTFPTLDCSACILTPKMVDVPRNKNIELLTYSEITGVEGYVGNFKVKIKQKPKYIDWSKCSGCGECARKDLSGELKVENGYAWVDRVKIDENECIQCGDCIKACVEENKDKIGITDVFFERKRRMLGEEVAERKQKIEKALMEDIYKMSLDERRKFWENELSKCIKCYSCRDACPICLCDYCELEDENWVPRGQIPPEYPLFHIIRAYHLAGKCIGCGECERACPMHIPIRTIQDLVRDEKPEKVFEFVPGLDKKKKAKLIKALREKPIEKRKLKL